MHTHVRAHTYIYRERKRKERERERECVCVCVYVYVCVCVCFYFITFYKDEYFIPESTYSKITNFKVILLSYHIFEFYQSNSPCLFTYIGVRVCI